VKKGEKDRATCTDTDSTYLSGVVDWCGLFSSPFSLTFAHASPTVATVTTYNLLVVGFAGRTANDQKVTLSTTFDITSTWLLTKLARRDDSLISH
jgi:hypothetical protein